MKKILSITFALAITSLMFAGNPTEISSCASAYPDQIRVLMQSHENFYAGKDLTGKVKITFTVAADNSLRILDVDSENIYLENHALQSLNGQKLEGSCSGDSQVYTILVDFIYVI